MNRNWYELEPVWTGTGLWKLKYAQNGHFWRNYDFLMIFYDFSMPENRKMTKKIKIEKNQVEQKLKKPKILEKKNSRQLRQFAI